MADDNNAKEDWIDFDNISCIKCDRFVEEINSENLCPECEEVSDIKEQLEIQRLQERLEHLKKCNHDYNLALHKKKKALIQQAEKIKQLSALKKDDEIEKLKKEIFNRDCVIRQTQNNFKNLDITARFGRTIVELILNKLQELSYITQNKKYFILKSLHKTHSLDNQSLKTGIDAEVQQNRDEIDIQNETFNNQNIVDKNRK